MHFCIWGSVYLAVGKVVHSDSPVVCADSDFISSTDVCLCIYAFLFRGPVFLEIMSAFLFVFHSFDHSPLCMGFLDPGQILP